MAIQALPLIAQIIGGILMSKNNTAGQVFNSVMGLATQSAKQQNMPQPQTTTMGG